MATTTKQASVLDSQQSKSISSATDALNRLLASAVGSIVAEVATLPADVIKTRLQIQKSVAHSRTLVASHANEEVYTGMFNAVYNISRHEGMTALWKGLCPALLRQVSYTGLALIIFEPIRDGITRMASQTSADDTAAPPGFLIRVAAGGTAGGIGIAVMNPTEVLKTQLQSSQLERLTMRRVMQRVYANEGLLGFWAGVRPNIARAFLINAAEIGSYDYVKHEILNRGIVSDDGLGCRVMSSFAAGTLSALISTPVDVVKTRLMNQAGQTHEMDGMFRSLYTIPRNEGPFALYKGFFPIIIRKVVWCTAFWLTYENVRESLGLPSKQNNNKI